MSPPTKADFEKLRSMVTALDRDVALFAREAAEARVEARTANERVDRYREENAALRTEKAVLRQRVDDVVKRNEEGDRRRWALVGLVLGAVLTFVANLVVALTRR